MLIQQSQMNLETNKQEAEMESTDRRTSGEDGASSWGMRGGGKERWWRRYREPVEYLRGSVSYSCQMTCMYNANRSRERYSFRAELERDV